ncbi:MAG: DUF58 domain-containing protein [Bacteroidota bacterium]
MKNIWSIVKQVRFSKLFYQLIFALVVGYIFAYFFPILEYFFNAFLIVLVLLIVIDAILLFKNNELLTAFRKAKHSRLSNGDQNDLQLIVENRCNYKVHVSIVDELPFQFQIRNFEINTNLTSGEIKQFAYNLTPIERGEYHFGVINLFIQSPLRILERHSKITSPFMMECYPSFLKLRQYELMAISNRLNEAGMKKIRKIGNSTEFEQIKEYVQGDDIRKINWKATARKSQLMVNHYIDEKAQQVYCVVDMGRVMKMPFDNLMLLDYAINASLVLGHVAWIKQDKPGLIGFNKSISTKVVADRKGNQLLRLQQALYNAKTNFEETNFENLLGYLRTNVTQRSLLLLFTNFETLGALKRQIKYIRKMASQHLVVVIFFKNTELDQLLNKKVETTFELYEQTIAQKFDYEKRQIVKELQQYGILSVYTTPQNLTVNTLNKYLEIKTRNLI